MNTIGALLPTGPLLEHLMRRLSETPPALLQTPATAAKTGVQTGALAGDVLRNLGVTKLDLPWLAGLCPVRADKAVLNALRVTQVASWLLADPWFHGKADAAAAQAWLRDQLTEVAAVTKAEAYVSDDERREELARLCLKALGLRPQGESEAQAQDRLESISSVERNRMIAAARNVHEANRKRRETEEARAREVRETMERKAAEEAAAKGTRE